MTDTSTSSAAEAHVTDAEKFIAIDGPAGSGKSSVSKAVARKLGFGYLDTGSAYRALAWHVLDRGADTDDSEAVRAAASDFPVQLGLDPDDRTVLVGDAEITEAIRDPRVSGAVSGVARVPEVRAQVNELFRKLVSESSYPAVVVEGRDITTVVAPDAPVRILLTAAPEVRAARRAGELAGENAVAVAAALHKRDASDSAVVDFLNAAEGVEVVDSTELDFPQTIDAVLTVIEQHRGAHRG
ncbi:MULTISPECIES: (d)CMP kinase [unclassified Microbacterium]|uniref:(d)CMP kinase n=1 Tax=unclassified Microbacterium TaxID=2609290 RepID=UPI000CFB4FDF|nr:MULTISPECIES: (d)CMP kinase [unclassified Microbacterium]PQZ48761.1 cytidylate kinase [Microbacterium sp. MYb43]PQZ72431.1 cytidylate kinase [Microbacterium sp. MYb40]PRB14554.1 cytidylate kinase [Microbacterium sp. MYb54]PRB21286.1 cytidylate kinase [Microbacterium sp. MYb50]PRB66702.1 cytidylate kinase [Microbacterium sp. MYb32]